MDLPGSYGLDPVADDQRVAKQALLFDSFDAVVVVIDAADLERKLYQALQLINLQLPVVIALNLIDYAARKGVSVDKQALGQILGVQVIPTVAVTAQGVRELLDAVVGQCIATMGVLCRELGQRATIIIMAGDIGIAFVIGALILRASTLVSLLQ